MPFVPVKGGQWQAAQPWLLVKQEAVVPFSSNGLTPFHSHENLQEVLRTLRQDKVQIAAEAAAISLLAMATDPSKSQVFVEVI